MNSIRDLIDLHYKNKLPHLSSTLTAYPIIKKIYAEMEPDDVFILSQGHAALALYTVLGQGQRLLDKYGPHPHRSIEDGIYCSTGSLGMGITVAVGAALTGKRVHVLISDGECAEGCIWEALNYAKNLPNLKIHANCNFLSALGDVDAVLYDRLTSYGVTLHFSGSLPPPFVNGINDHYRVLSEEDYAQAIRHFAQ